MENNELPEVTKRIKEIIDKRFNGNVRQFCFAMGLPNSAKINRLFLKDKRNDNYPIPSTDILYLISKTFDVSTDWLIMGETYHEKKNVNNINIDNKKINGDKNITNSNDVNVQDTSEYLDIIKKQQEQINTLIELIAKSK